MLDFLLYILKCGIVSLGAILAWASCFFAVAFAVEITFNEWFRNPQSQTKTKTKTKTQTQTQKQK